jgi:hypothetical protein
MNADAVLSLTATLNLFKLGAFMPNITQRSKDYLLHDMICFYRDDYDELAKLLSKGIKGMDEMNEDELLALFREYGVEPAFEVE